MHGANTNPYVISGGVAEEPSEALSFLKPLQGSSPLNIRYRDKKLSFFFLKIQKHISLSTVLNVLYVTGLFHDVVQ